MRGFGLILLPQIALAIWRWGGDDIEKKGTLEATPYAITKASNIPSKLKMSEIVTIVVVEMPVEAGKALNEAETLIKMTKNRNTGYTYGNLPKYRLEAVKNTLNLLRDTQNALQASRVKRGWFDLIGKFLHISTGVATDDDITALRQEFIGNDESVVTNMKKLIINNNVLTKAIQKLTAASRVQKDLLVKEINRDKLWHRMSNAISLASELCQVSATLTLQYKWLIDRLRLNMLPESLNNVTLFRHLIEDNFDMSQIYFDPEYLIVEPTKQLSKFYIKLPVFSSSTFFLNEVVPLPLQKANESFIIIENYERYVGLSESNYFLSNVKPDCIPPNDKRKFALCNSDVKLFDKKIQTCSLDLVMQKNMTSCSFKRYGGNKKFFIRKSEESFIIKFFQETKVTVTCGNKRVFRKLLGTLILNPPCHLRSDLVTVVTNNKLFSKNRIKIEDWNTSHFFDKNLNFEEEVVFSHEEKNMINIINSTLEEAIKLNLTELKNDSFLWKKVSVIHMTVNFWIILVILMIMGGTALYFTIKRCKKAPEKENKDVYCCLHPLEQKADYVE